MSFPTAFVCGVTGTQGSAVARNLLSKGAQVHALVRNPTSENALAMQSLGVKLFSGDYNNPESLTTAIKGCSAVFLNLTPSFTNTGAELLLAKSIITIAKASGIKHFIYTSAPAVNSTQELTHLDPNSFTAQILLSKQAIEQETRSAGFPHWTILRPGNFMTNFLKPMVYMQTGLTEQGRWSNAFEKTTLLPMVDPDTIGKFASAAFLNPTKFHAQEIELADEFLTADQIMDKLSSATGRDLKAVYLSGGGGIDAQKATNPFISGQLAMRDLAKFVDINKVKSWEIPLSSFDSFIEREKARVVDTYLH